MLHVRRIIRKGCHYSLFAKKQLQSTANETNDDVTTVDKEKIKSLDKQVAFLGRRSKKPIQQSIYAYKKINNTYYDWMFAVNKVVIPRDDLYRPLILRNVVKQILRYMSDSYFDFEQWLTFRDYLVKKDIGISRLFDGVFLHECVDHQRYLMALSYIDFLRKEDIELTPTGLAMLLLLARQMDIKSQYADIKISEDELLKAYDEFIKIQPIPDSLLTLPIISGLTLTRKWKESIKHLPILENDLESMQTALGYILTAAAKYHDYNFFFQLIDNVSQTEEIRIRKRRDRTLNYHDKSNESIKTTMTKNKKGIRTPFLTHMPLKMLKESDYYLISKTSQAYETFTNYLTGDKQMQINSLKKLLEKSQHNGYIPPLGFVQALEKKLKEIDQDKYRCDHIYFAPNGVSTNNQSCLPSIELNEDESQLLHRYVQDNFVDLIRKNCPSMTNDINKLENIHQCLIEKKVDVIFDCVHYPLLELDWSNRYPLYVKRILQQIVHEKEKTCLVLAKAHIEDYINQLDIQNTHVIRAHYETGHSALPILVALFNGPQTLLASAIDQRPFKSILEIKHVALLDQWIQTHQLVAIVKPDLVYLQAPCVYSTQVHMQEKQWLIPYYDGSPLADAEK
ncbi:unnamed protein product, partial [Didymodactylos carnosus]